MHFLLPFPPSVNTPYSISRGKRVKSVKVKAWEKLASQSVNKQNIIPYIGRCIIIYGLHHPDNRARDAANYEKITTDFLVSKGVLKGDDRRFIQGIFSYWNDVPGDFINVWIQDARIMDFQNIFTKDLH